MFPLFIPLGSLALITRVLLLAWLSITNFLNPRFTLKWIVLKFLRVALNEQIDSILLQKHLEMLVFDEGIGVESAWGTEACVGSVARFERSSRVDVDSVGYLKLLVKSQNGSFKFEDFGFLKNCLNFLFS